MGIAWNCSCGLRLRAKEELAGRSARCPKCGSVVLVPGRPSVAGMTGGVCDRTAPKKGGRGLFIATGALLVFLTIGLATQLLRSRPPARPSAPLPGVKTPLAERAGGRTYAREHAPVSLRPAQPAKGDLGPLIRSKATQEAKPVTEVTSHSTLGGLEKAGPPTSSMSGTEAVADAPDDSSACPFRDFLYLSLAGLR